MGIRADEGRRPRTKICPADLPPEKTAEMQEIAAEAGVPLYQNLDGPQLETDLIVTVGAQYAF